MKAIAILIFSIFWMGSRGFFEYLVLISEREKGKGKRKKEKGKRKKEKGKSFF